MNGFKKNKNGTTKRNVKNYEIANDQLGENASNNSSPEDYSNVKKNNQKGK